MNSNTSNSNNDGDRAGKESSETIPGVYQFVQAILYRRSLFNVTCEDAESLFDAIDKDKDCIISGIELYGAAKRLGLGLAEEQINLVMLEMGIPEGLQGHVTKAEFITFFENELERLRQEKRTRRDSISQSQHLIEKPTQQTEFTSTHHQKRLLHPAITLGYEQFRNAPDLQEREDAKLMGGSFHDPYYNRERHTSSKNTSEMRRQSAQYYSRLQESAHANSSQWQPEDTQPASVPQTTAKQDLDEAGTFIQQARLWKHAASNGDTATKGQEPGFHAGGAESPMKANNQTHTEYGMRSHAQQHQNGIYGHTTLPTGQRGYDTTDNSSGPELSELKRKVQFLERALQEQERTSSLPVNSNGYQHGRSQATQVPAKQHSSNSYDHNTAAAALENMTAEELEQTRNELYHLQQQVMQMANDARDAVSDLAEKRSNFEEEKKAFENYRTQLEREASYLEEERRELNEKEKEINEREEISQKNHAYELERLEKALEDTRQSRDKALKAARSKTTPVSQPSTPANNMNQSLVLALARLYMLTCGRLTRGSGLSTLLDGVESKKSEHCSPRFRSAPQGLTLELEFSDLAQGNATLPSVHTFCRLVSYDPEEVAYPLFAPRDTASGGSRSSLFANSSRVQASSVGEKYIDIQLPIQEHELRASVGQVLVGPSDTAPSGSQEGHTPQGIYEMLNSTARNVFCGGESGVILTPTIETCQAIVGETHCGILQALFEGRDNSQKIMQQLGEHMELGKRGADAVPSLSLRIAYVDIRPVFTDNGYGASAFEVRDLLSNDATGVATVVSETSSSGWLDLVHFEVISDLRGALGLVEQAYRNRFEMNMSHFLDGHQDHAHPAAGLFSHGVLVTELVSNLPSESDQDNTSMSGASDSSLCEIAGMIQLKSNNEGHWKPLGRHYAVETGTLADARYAELPSVTFSANKTYGRSNGIESASRRPTLMCYIPQQVKHGAPASLTELLTRKSLTLQQMTECSSIFFGKTQLPQSIAGITGLSTQSLSLWYGKGELGEHRAIQHLAMVFPEDAFMNKHTQMKRSSITNTEKDSVKNVPSGKNSFAHTPSWQPPSHADRYLMRRRGYLNGPQKRAFEQGGQIIPPTKGSVEKGIHKMQRASVLSPANFATYNVRNGGGKVQSEQDTRRSRRRNSVEEKLAQLSFDEHNVSSTRNHASHGHRNSTSGKSKSEGHEWNPVPGMHQFLDMLLQGKQSESQDDLQFIMERIDFLYSFLQNSAGEREDEMTNVTAAAFAKGLVKVLPTFSINAVFSYMLPMLQIQPNQNVDFEDFCEAVANLAYHRFSQESSSQGDNFNVNGPIDDHVNELCGLDEVLAQEQEALQVERHSIS